MHILGQPDTSVARASALVLIERGGGRCSGKACGVAITVRTCYRLVKAWSPLPAIRGRGGALRIRLGGLDVDLPARGSLPATAMRQAAEDIFGWAGMIMAVLPRRTTPLWGMDLNDAMGIACEDDHFIRPSSELVGAVRAGREHVFGTAVRAFA